MGRRVNPSYRPYPHPNPSRVIFRRYQIPADNVTLRVAGKFHGGGIHKHGGDCRMRNEIALFNPFFQFLHGQLAFRKRYGLKIQPREQSKTKKV